MSNPFVPLETADLSWPEGLPFSQTFGDIYFSKDDGLAEAKHVFIDGNKLIERWQALSKEDCESFVIAETGFGTGLNFLLTWLLWLDYAPKTARLYFISCEKYPLKQEDLARCLSIWPQLHVQAKSLLADYPILTPGYHHLQFENGRINLTLMLGDAESCFNQRLICGDTKLEQELRTNYVDAWFLDGFAPSKNQAMWSNELFHAISLQSKPGTTLATFSVASLVRSNLQAAGFKVEKIKGFGRKREMVVAHLIEPLLSNSKSRSTPWHVARKKSPNTKTVLIIGAGLAGCYLAHALAKRGWLVTLVDEQNQVGQGASGNRQAVLYPKLSAFRSPLTMFMLTAFLYASRTYSALLAEHAIGELSGILQLAITEKERVSQDSMKEWLSAYPELGVLVNAEEASLKAGVELETGGLFIPRSGWIDSFALCQLLSQTPGIGYLPNTTASELVFNKGQWHAAGQRADILIVTNGYQATQFMQTSHFPLKTIRGQMTIIAANKESQKLKIPLCGEGHVLPENKGSHAIGASYNLGSTDKNSSFSDDLSNLSKLTKMRTNIVWPTDIINNWVGLRAATTDYLPMVGPVPDVELFKARFASLATNAKRWLPFAGDYLPGLFLCTGFGSRGLTTIPLCADWLASMINNEPSLLTRSMEQSLSPARFLHKGITKNLG